MVLTDGEPNQEPNEGHIPALENWIKSNNFCPSINSYSFGK